MTKKHFIAFARYIAGHINRTEARALAEMVAIVAAGDNPRFDRERFMSACGFYS